MAPVTSCSAPLSLSIAALNGINVSLVHEEYF